MLWPRKPPPNPQWGHGGGGHPQGRRGRIWVGGAGGPAGVFFPTLKNLGVFRKKNAPFGTTPEKGATGLHGAQSKPGSNLVLGGGPNTFSRGAGKSRNRTKTGKKGVKIPRGGVRVPLFFWAKGEWLNPRGGGGPGSRWGKMGGILVGPCCSWRRVPKGGGGGGPKRARGGFPNFQLPAPRKNSCFFREGGGPGPRRDFAGGGTA